MLFFCGCETPFDGIDTSGVSKSGKSKTAPDITDGGVNRYLNLMSLNYSDTVITGKFHDWRPESKYRLKAGYHNGYDFAAPAGTEVPAGWEGTVTDIIYWGYGEFAVKIKKNKQMTQYGHMNNLRVCIGQKITTGQIIGKIAVDHVDVKMKVNGYYYDFGKQ
jgi:murein DD-endopeptidase MepM/ murein hydrolase activator NlpD